MVARHQSFSGLPGICREFLSRGRSSIPSVPSSKGFISPSTKANQKLAMVKGSVNILVKRGASAAPTSTRTRSGTAGPIVLVARATKQPKAPGDRLPRAAHSCVFFVPIRTGSARAQQRPNAHASAVSVTAVARQEGPPSNLGNFDLDRPEKSAGSYAQR